MLTRRVISAIGIAAATASVLVFTGGTAQASACTDQPHTRPTISGWAADPCAHETIDFGSYTVRSSVDFYWSMSGGAHITDTRGFFRICNESSSITAVSADAVALHKFIAGGELFVQNTMTQQVSSDCATMVTPSRAVRGCGGRDAPLGPASYSLYNESRGAYRTTDGVLHRAPSGDAYYGTLESYYRVVVAGAAC